MPKSAVKQEAIDAAWAIKHPAGGFFVATRDGFLEVAAKSVKIRGYPDGDFFVHRKILVGTKCHAIESDSLHTVSEGRSGRSIIDGCLSPKDAKEDARRRIEKSESIRPGSFRAAVEAAMRENGVSPRYTAGELSAEQIRDRKKAAKQTRQQTTGELSPEAEQSCRDTLRQLGGLQDAA